MRDEPRSGQLPFLFSAGCGSVGVCSRSVLMRHTVSSKEFSNRQWNIWACLHVPPVVAIAILMMQSISNVSICFKVSYGHTCSAMFGYVHSIALEEHYVCLQHPNVLWYLYDHCSEREGVTERMTRTQRNPLDVWTFWKTDASLFVHEKSISTSCQPCSSVLQVAQHP